MTELRTKFDVDSIDQAKKLLAKLKQKRDAAATKLEQAIEEFEDEWGDHL